MSKLFSAGSAIVVFFVFQTIPTFSYNICIDPGHGYFGTNGWGNCGPMFNTSGNVYWTLKKPINDDSSIESISSNLVVPQSQWDEWQTLRKLDAQGTPVPVGLLEYQNTWKIANFLKNILENRNHTVHLTKSEHANPTFSQRAQVALDNNCDFMISIHTNAPGNNQTALGLFYAKSLFRVDYYRGTPPPTPVETDFTPAAWDDDFEICKSAVQTQPPARLPYVVGNNGPDQPIWLQIKAVAKQGTPRAVPFDPAMVRYKIDHQGTSDDEENWMPAGNDPSYFLTLHRYNEYNTWAVSARYDVRDASTPEPDIDSFETHDSRQTPTPLYIDGLAEVVLRGPHQSDTSENITKKIMGGLQSHPEIGGSGYLNGCSSTGDWHFYFDPLTLKSKHLDLFKRCSKWHLPNEADRKEIPVFIVECGFHSNPEFEEWLYHNGCEDRYYYIAEAIANGIDSITDEDFENRPDPTPGPSHQFADLEDTPVPGNSFYIDTQSLYVNSEYDDSCGESWGSPCAPYKTINEAMGAAWDGVTIKVAKGTYAEQLWIYGEDYNIKLMGGYNPTTWEQDIPSNPTIIELNTADPLIYIGIETKSTIDGFNIRGHYNALEIGDAQPIVSNNIITSSHGYGIAMYDCNSGSVLIHDNLIKDCRASGKTGIRVDNSDIPEIFRNEFANCSIGIRCTAGANPAIHYNRFSTCVSGILISEARPDIWGNMFQSNTQGVAVLGMYDAGAIVRNNVFYQNTSAGIIVFDAEIDLVNNTFDSNYRGILYDPNLAMNDGKVSNCIFSNNAHSGVCALNASGQLPDIENCDFWQNGTSGLCDVNVSLLNECYEMYESMGCFRADPGFITGPEGDFYLEQTGNQCVDGGEIPASGLYSNGFTTDPEELQDTGLIDIGLHYQFPTATPTLTPTPSATPTPSPTSTGSTSTPTITPTSTEPPASTNTPLQPPICPPTATNPPAGSAWVWPDSSEYYSLLAQGIMNLDDSSYYLPTSYRDTPTPVVLSIHVISTEDGTGFDMDVSEIIPGTGLFDTMSAGTNLGFTSGASEPISKRISVVDGSIVTVSYDDPDPPGTITDTFIWYAATWTPSPTPEFSQTPTPTTTSIPENTSTPTNTPNPIEWTITDQYGYQSERVPCDWYDAGDGTPASITGDDTITSTILPFDFYFYDQFFPSGSIVTIGSNGLISLSNNQIVSGINQAIPESTSPNGIICPFWDDLYLLTGSIVYTKSDGISPDRRLIIEWSHASHYDNMSDDYTFELVLFEGTNMIEFHYNEMIGYFSDGFSASIGIEADSGDDGLQFSSSGVPGYVYDCLSLRLIYPGTPTPVPTITPTPPPIPALSSNGIMVLLILMGFLVMVFARAIIDVNL